MPVENFITLIKIITTLNETYTPEGVTVWLTSTRSELNGNTPWWCIITGQRLEDLEELARGVV